MDWVWIRPVKKPVHPRDIEDLSSPARKVLQSLERRFAPRNPVCIASSVFQPGPRRQDQPVPFDRNTFGVLGREAHGAVRPGELLFRPGRCLNPENYTNHPTSRHPDATCHIGQPHISSRHPDATGQPHISSIANEQQDLHPAQLIQQEGIFIPQNILPNLDKSTEENNEDTARQPRLNNENVSSLDISMYIGTLTDLNNSPPISNYDLTHDKSMNSFLSMSPIPISNYDIVDEGPPSNFISMASNEVAFAQEPQDENIFGVMSQGAHNAVSRGEPLFKPGRCFKGENFSNSCHLDKKRVFVPQNLLTNLEKESIEEKDGGTVKQPEACESNNENVSPLDISMEISYLADPNNTPPRSPNSGTGGGEPQNNCAPMTPNNNSPPMTPDNNSPPMTPNNSPPISIYDIFDEEANLHNDTATSPKPALKSTEPTEVEKENCTPGSDRFNNTGDLMEHIDSILITEKIENNLVSLYNSPLNDITQIMNKTHSLNDKKKANEKSLEFVKEKPVSNLESPQIVHRQMCSISHTLSAESSSAMQHMLSTDNAPVLSPQTGKRPLESNHTDFTFDTSATAVQNIISDENKFKSSGINRSLNMAKEQSSNAPTTPGSTNRKKFLGTPFQRALSSNSLAPKVISEEMPHPNVEESSPHMRRSNENDSIGTEKASSTKDQNIDFCSLFQIDLPCEKMSENPQPPALFSIFTGQSKRKANKIENPLSQSSTSSKKKIKFMVPYKRDEPDVRPSTSSHKDIQALSVKLSKEMNSNSRKLKLQKLNEILAHDISKRIKSAPPDEISLTLQYRGGFCQLNRLKTSENLSPESILVRIMWSSDVKYISIPVLKYSWSSELVRILFTDNTRKVCFEAQEMIQLVVDKFGFSASEVSSQWLILDPLVGCWLLNPDEPPQSFKDVLTMMKLSEEMEGIEILLSKLSECAKVLYEHLTKNGLWKLFLHIEMRIIPILACMELHGIQVDVKKFEDMRTLLKARLEDVEKLAYRAAGRQFLLNSPQQLGNVLYDHLKLDVKHNISVKETDKKHNKSTSEPTLIKFKDAHPLPGLVLEYRRLHKLKSTYVDAILGHVSGDSIYTTWDQISAATGRITSSEPNLQTIPKQPLMPDQPNLLLRTGFVARNGYSFLAADFQHIELRVFAHLSKDTALIRALSQSTDVFKILSQQWLQIEDIRKVTDEDRDKTKRIMYALMYGAGASKLVEFLHIDFNQANEILQKFSGTFPKMDDFSKSVVRNCRRQGYLTTETGRKRLFPNINNSNYQIRMHSERQAVNFLVQGTAADLCKCAMVQTQRYLTGIGSQKFFPQARLLLQIHDELLWEIPDSDVMDAADVVQEAMEGATSAFQGLSNFSVPLPVVMKIGKNWGDLKIVKNVSLGIASQQT